MTTILQTSFENGSVAPGGTEFTSTTNAGSISIDSTNFIDGTHGCLFTANGSVTLLHKTISTQIITGTIGLRFTSYPSTSEPLIRSFQASNTHFQFALAGNGQVQAGLALNGSAFQQTNSRTILRLGVWYIIDFRWDASTTTWKIDYRILDQQNRVMEAPAQFTQSGLAATTFTDFQLGPQNAVATQFTTDLIKLTDQTVDHPLTTAFVPATVDTNPLSVSGGFLFGQNSSHGVGPLAAQLQTNEGVTKANRRIYMTHAPYSEVHPPSDADMVTIGQMMDGTLLGHQVIPVISGFGFDQATTNWPAGGLADFTSGAMNTVLDGWAAKFNKLPNLPYIFRLFREMNNTAVIYGVGGASVGGLNETTAGFVAAWQYIATYLRARVTTPMRVGWCPQASQGAPLDTLVQWYPGDGYVDDNGIDAYLSGGGAAALISNLTPFYFGFGPSGSVSRKPIIHFETQVDRNDASRITDIQAYTTIADAVPGFWAWCFWDTAAGGQYEVADVPAGFLAAYQATIAAPEYAGLLPALPAATSFTIDIEALWNQHDQDISRPFVVTGAPATINLEAMWNQYYRDSSKPFAVTGVNATINLEALWNQHWRDSSKPFLVTVNS